MSSTGLPRVDCFAEICAHHRSFRDLLQNEINLTDSHDGKRISDDTLTMMFEAGYASVFLLTVKLCLALTDVGAQLGIDILKKLGFTRVSDSVVDGSSLVRLRNSGQFDIGATVAALAGNYGLLFGVLQKYDEAKGTCKRAEYVRHLLGFSQLLIGTAKLEEQVTARLLAAVAAALPESHDCVLTQLPAYYCPDAADAAAPVGALGYVPEATNGYLYVLVNPAMPGLAKVGKTTRDPEARVAELSAATGVPTQFFLVYKHPVADCGAAELWVHKELERRGYRLASNREFFRGPVHEIVALIVESAGVTCIDSASSKALYSQRNGRNTSLADELLEMGCAYRDGIGDVLRSSKRALECFTEAAKLGNGLACVWAGMILEAGSHAAGKKDPDGALEMYRRGLSCGAWIAHGRIAHLFHQAGQTQNEEENWVKLFHSAFEARVSGNGAAGSLVGTLGAHYCCQVALNRIRHVVDDAMIKEFANSLNEAIEDQLNALDNVPQRATSETRLRQARDFIQQAVNRPFGFETRLMPSPQGD